MLLTTLATVGTHDIQSVLTGEKKLSDTSSSTGATIGSIIGIAIGIFAVTLNYRRNHSLFYAFLAFLFSEIYVAYVLVGFLFKKFKIE